MTASEEHRSHNNPPEILPILPPEITEDQMREVFTAMDAAQTERLPYDPNQLELLAVNVSAFCDAAGQWKHLGQISRPEQSERLTDFVTGARQLFKKVDAARDAAKRPHTERAERVQAAFKPLLEKLTRVGEDMKAMQADWLRREQARIEAEKAEQRRQAEAAAAEARRLADQAAARGDISGEVDAEAALAEAEKARKAAEKPANVKASSATGGGRTMALRTQAYAEIFNFRAVFMHFEDSPEVTEVLQRLADRAVRAGQDVPGANRRERQVAA